MKAFLLLTFLVSINVSVAQREIYFVEQQPTYVSYSTWLLTLSVDVESYSANIRLIKQEVDEFYKQFQFILTHYNHSRVSDENIKTDAFQAQLQNVHVDLAHLMWKQVDHFDLIPIPRWPSGMFKAIGTEGRGFEPRPGLAVPQKCYWNGPFQYNVAGPTYYGR